MKTISISLVATVLLVSSLSLSADQYAVTLRDTSLHDKPFRDASQISSIAADTRLLVLKRKGGWYQVQNNEQTGWVRLTSLRLQHGGNKAKGNAKNKGKASAPGQQKKHINSLDTLGDALSGGLFTTGRSSQVTSTTGIRGLDEEDIGNARPDPQALAKLNSYSVSPEQAQRFARKARLTSTRLDYLAGDSARKGRGGLFDLFRGGNTNQPEEEVP